MSSLKVLVGQLKVVAGRLDAHMARHRIYDRDHPMPGVESLEDLNRTDGLCPTCRRTTGTGTGNDRLRRTTVAEGAQKLVCDACRKAWARRDHTHADETGAPQLDTYDACGTERRC